MLDHAFNLARRIVRAADTEDATAKRDCVLSFRAMSETQRNATLAELARQYQGSNLNLWA